jgi:tRNA-binding protein
MHVTHDPAALPSGTIGFDQFLAVDIRVGTVVEALPFPEARKPASK